MRAHCSSPSSRPLPTPTLPNPPPCRHDAGCTGTDYAPASYLSLPPGSPALPAECEAVLPKAAGAAAAATDGAGAPAPAPAAPKASASRAGAPLAAVLALVAAALLAV